LGVLSLGRGISFPRCRSADGKASVPISLAGLDKRGRHFRAGHGDPLEDADYLGIGRTAVTAGPVCQSTPLVGSASKAIPRMLQGAASDGNADG
jgi:hypothetical protein